MFYKILILVTVFCFTELLAQIDTTRKDFYPLKIGNLWQYRNESNNLVKQEVIGDTVIDGIKYYLLIHSLRTSGGGIMRVDSMLRIINGWGGPFWGDTCGGNTPYESSIYHLNEEDSTAWKICETFSGHLGEQLVRFNRITTTNILGQQREVMHFDYGCAIQGEDTTWSYGARMVKGIGIVEEQYFDGAYRILQGAIIGGVQYGTIVSVNEVLETIPQKIILYQNYPNPFNPSTKIKYEIPELTNVSLIIFNVFGEQIAELVNNVQPPGIYETEFNAVNLSSGVYIAVLKTNEAQLANRLLLLK